MKDYRAAAQKMGFELRPWQDEVLAYGVTGDDFITIVKTSGGKSLVYAVLIDLDGSGLTIVVSPFRALQQDQAQRFCGLGMRAVLLNSDLSKKERRDILDRLDEVDVLFLAPEQLEREDLREALADVAVNRVVLDEAHTLPQSRAVFRPAFGEIGSFIASLPDHPQVIACTATATKNERQEIIESLGMRDPKTFTFPVRRENLHLHVKELPGGERGELLLFQAVEDELRSWKKKGKGCAVIYCPTPNRVMELTKWLKSRNYDCTMYTGPMKAAEREDSFRAFMSGDVKIMVATNAFGVGIDKPNVRLLIQAGLPVSFSGYVQEIGRSGRNGKTARCVLFYAPSDVSRNQQILRTENREEYRRRMKELRQIKAYVDSDICRWKQIEAYFEEKPGKKCKHCDNCIKDA